MIRQLIYTVVLFSVFPTVQAGTTTKPESSNASQATDSQPPSTLKTTTLSNTTASPPSNNSTRPLPSASPNSIDPTLTTMRTHDIMYFYGEVTINQNAYITVRIHDSECFSSQSESSYVIYLAALTFDNDFISWHAIHSDQRLNYDSEKGISLYEITLGKDELPNLDFCFTFGKDICVPRADVVYIQYHNEPEDSWSISLIEVEVQFRLWHGGENWHVFRYEHSVLMPCESWMDEVGLYQIGPRIGLFLKLDEVPVPGEWVRDWV